MSLATLVGCGIGSPNSRSVCRWPEIASRTFCSVSSKVFPVVTQPGRSGALGSPVGFGLLENDGVFLVHFPQPSSSTRQITSRTLTCFHCNLTSELVGAHGNGI